MKTSTRERRDWTLLIFIIPIGIILMLIAGQIAIRLAPLWSISADMRSNLDPNHASKQVGLMQPIGMGILTPYKLNLTPGIIDFPPIIVLEPDGTLTTVPSQEPTAFPTTTRVAATPTSTKFNTAVPTATTRPTQNPTNTKFVTATFTSNPTKTKTPTPTSTSNYTQTPTPTSTSIFTPTFTPTLTPIETPTATSSPTATPTGFPSTPDPNWTEVSPIDVIGGPDGTIDSILPGSYMVLDISASPIIVDGNSDFDLVYYESEFVDPSAPIGYIYLDAVILGISKSSDRAAGYYDIFNWGNGAQDWNTNISDVADVVNQQIFLDKLWDWAKYPINPSTGILVDADTVPSIPPPGTYNYLWVICPYIDPPLESLEVNSIQIFP